MIETWKDSVSFFENWGHNGQYWGHRALNTGWINEHRFLFFLSSFCVISLFYGFLLFLFLLRWISCKSSGQWIYKYSTGSQAWSLLQGKFLFDAYDTRNLGGQFLPYRLSESCRGDNTTLALFDPSLRRHEVLLLRAVEVKWSVKVLYIFWYLFFFLVFDIFIFVLNLAMIERFS